jgi:hypothetical protein
MSECRNVGMSECRNVGMSECRNVEKHLKNLCEKISISKVQIKTPVSYNLNKSLTLNLIK